MFADIARAITHLRLTRASECSYGLTLAHRMSIELLKREYSEDAAKVRDGRMLKKLAAAHERSSRDKVLRTTRYHKLRTRNERKLDKVIYMGCAGWAPDKSDAGGRLIHENGWINVAQTTTSLESVVRPPQLNANQDRTAANL